jgi:hypothetical protein
MKIGESEVSLLVRSDGFSSLVEHEPLVSVVWSMGSDSHNELVSSNVLSHIKCSGRSHVCSNLELDSIS